MKEILRSTTIEELKASFGTELLPELEAWVCFIPVRKFPFTQVELTMYVDSVTLSLEDNE